MEGRTEVDYEAIEGNEFRVESKGMSYGVAVDKRDDGRIVFERGDKRVSEAPNKVASWVDADWVTVE